MKYTRIENLTWELLLRNRKDKLATEACDIYLTSLDNLKLPLEYVPSFQEMNQLIQKVADWKMIPTKELVTYTDYYTMLANHEFPAITTIRPLEQIHYYENKEPDVIHEYFGHGPFLIHDQFSKFMNNLAKFALTRSSYEQVLLGRLFWFTIEFGLIQTAQGLKVYGAGIIPSQDETWHALHENNTKRQAFNLVDVLRTPISYSKHKVYYVIESFNDLYALNDDLLSQALLKARELGNLSSNTL